MYRPNRRATVLPEADSAGIVVRLKSKSARVAEDNSRDRSDQETEALIAAVSLGLILIVLAFSLVAKVWGW
jgi:hypothetical protein